MRDLSRATACGIVLHIPVLRHTAAGTRIIPRPGLEGRVRESLGAGSLLLTEREPGAMLRRLVGAVRDADTLGGLVGP
jgi:hypothetical protein